MNSSVIQWNVSVFSLVIFPGVSIVILMTMQFIVSLVELCETNTSIAGQMVCEINGFHLTYGINHHYLEI